MSAPTSKLNKPELVVAPVAVTAEDDVVLIDATGAEPAEEESMDTTEDSKDPKPATTTTTTAGVTLDQDGRPKFASVANNGREVRFEQRNIAIPPHRYTPLKGSWSKIYQPLVEHLHLQVRMDARGKRVSIRTCKQTSDPGAIQKGADFLKAFTLGFDVDDAVALLRLNDLFIETFEVKDVKTLSGDHLSRAIGRIAGKDGKTKFAIENASRTRVVLADSKIHILGGFENTKIARETIVSLILGAPPGKVYGNLRIISSRLKERF